jgi:iron-sulfur cluster assembly accessory protein
MDWRDYTKSAQAQLTKPTNPDRMGQIFLVEVTMNTPIQTQTVLLTPAAAGIVRGLLKERSLDDSYGLRVYVAGQTCSGLQYGMALDNKPAETDATFESEGLKVLVDNQSLQFMAGAKIDYIDDERGKGFLVENPNVPPACSCESGTCGSSEN